MRAWMMIGMLLWSAGCGEAHTVDVDSGPTLGDGGQCDPLGPAPFVCLAIDANHVCGDVAIRATCSAGTFSCPSGTAPEGSCWCADIAHASSCTCTPSGWSCPDAGTGIDAGPFVCPSDPSTLVGQACSDPDASCGSCPDPCGGGICNTVQCEGGTWEHSFFGCPAVGFPCGPTLHCEWRAQYCEHFLSDVAGEADTWSCTDFPQDCPSTCACFAGTPGPGMCTEDGGDVTMTFAGG